MEATQRICSDKRPFDNANVTYGPLIARAVDAEFSIQAISGIGLLHNYNDSIPLSGDPIGVYFDRTLKGSALPKWNFSAWTPDVVIIALGNNDFSTAVKPGKTQFTQAYKALIHALETHHPKAQILCLAFKDRFQESYIAVVVEELRAGGDARVHYAGMSPLDVTGCDWHPGVADNRKIADFLIPQVQALLPTTAVFRNASARDRRRPDGHGLFVRGLNPGWPEGGAGVPELGFRDGRGRQIPLH